MAEHHPPEGGEHAPDHEHSEGTERVREAIRDGFTIMLGAVWWAFDQTDQWAHHLLHEGQVSREESRRRFDEFAAHTRRVGEDLGRRVQDTVRTGKMPLATRDQVAHLERQVAELTRQLESLRGRPEASASGTATRERPPAD